MPRLAFDRHVGHSPDEMLSLVADLASYPRFIPNCRAMEVRPDRTADGSLAKMTLAFGPISQGYTSRVVVDRDRRTIDARAVDGPFAHLESRWSFEPEGQGTHIRFDIDFRISNPLIAAVAEPAFFSAKQAEIMDAFEAEADRRYGR